MSFVYKGVSRLYQTYPGKSKYFVKNIKNSVNLFPGDKIYPSHTNYFITTHYHEAFFPLPVKRS